MHSDLRAFFRCSHMEDEDPPKAQREAFFYNGFIVPSKVLPAIPAKGHAPGISRKPGMSRRGFTNTDGAGTGIEGVEIAFQS